MQCLCNPCLTGLLPSVNPFWHLSIDSRALLPPCSGKSLTQCLDRADGVPFVCLQVGVQEGADDEELLLSTAGGFILRTPVSSIRASSRAARGGLVSKLQEGDVVQAVTILQANESD